MSTTIEWTDETWNPVTGCTKVSPGCKNCYAERIADRLWSERKFTDVRTHPDRLDQPLKWRKPRRVFVNSMSDLFHEDVPFAFIDRVFAVMACAYWHSFQVLTKRPERMRDYLTGYAAGGRHIWTAGQALEMPRGKFKPSPGWPLPNVWLGVSVENQETADERIPLLLQTPAAVRFLSVEPLLGPVYLPGLVDDYVGELADALMELEFRRLRWVIVGGESGPGARPMDLAWARSIVAQCRAAGAACFVKQLGAKPFDSVNRKCVSAVGEPLRTEPWQIRLRDPKGGRPEEWPQDLRVREWPA